MAAGNQGFFGVSKVAKSVPAISSYSRENCTACGLSKQCVTPKLTSFGEGAKQVLIITDYPDLDADKASHLLSPSEYRNLRLKLKTIGLDIEQDCRIVGAMSCRPEVNDKGEIIEPSDKQVEACRPRVWRQIKEFKPRIIILLGDVALQSFLGHRWERDFGNILKWRGFVIPDRDVSAYVLPLIHPRMAVQDKANPVVDVITNDDMSVLAEYIDKDFVKFDTSKFNIRILHTPDQIRQALRELLQSKPEYIAFDYETSGVKPHRSGHFIECCSISYNDTDAIVFPILDEIRPLLIRLFHDASIKKIAHGLQFEDSWTRQMFNMHINGWGWCTKTAAHIIDNRDSITDLKFQVYVNYGIVDYSSSVEEYLHSAGGEKDKNSFNTVHLAPKQDLYYYCAQDAIYTRRIGMLQMTQVKEKELAAAQELFHNGLLALCDVSETGIAVDTAYIEEQSELLAHQIASLESQLWASKEGLLWKKLYAEKAALNSMPQLAAVLTRIVGTDMQKTTKGNVSVNAETLEKIDLPFVKDLLRRRTLKKTRDTFLANIQRETVGGILRPFFHLNTTISFRSSSSAPNFQNIPVRDEEIKNIVRSAIVPRPGNQILEIDYSGAEVRVSACVHKDPQMIRYITDPTTDMHRDCAMDIYRLEKDQVSKKIRQLTKGAWTFAQFYGDWYKACAKKLWEAATDPGFTVDKSDVTLMNHLHSQGIRGYNDFESHLKGVEDIFWHKRFKIYTKWKERHLEEYHVKGYFRTLTGFICGGVMRKNEALNLPIQGPSFHLLLWAFNRLNALRKQEQWQSVIVGQIHDSIVMDVVPAEVPYILKTCHRVMTQDIREWATWLVVPLEIEAEITGINEPWSKKKGIAIPH